MKTVEWYIKHPNKDKDIKVKSFKQAMSKYFEGYNVPVKTVDGI